MSLIAGPSAAVNVGQRLCASKCRPLGHKCFCVQSRDLLNNQKLFYNYPVLHNLKTSTNAGKHRLGRFGHRYVPGSWITEKGSSIVSQGGGGAYAHTIAVILMTLIDLGLSTESEKKK